jgi:hypothetical protein
MVLKTSVSHYVRPSDDSHYALAGGAVLEIVNCLFRKSSSSLV